MELKSLSRFVMIIIKGDLFVWINLHLMGMEIMKMIIDDDKYESFIWAREGKMKFNRFRSVTRFVTYSK
jgi:hypothetical protein